MIADHPGGVVTAWIPNITSRASYLSALGRLLNYNEDGRRRRDVVMFGYL